MSIVDALFLTQYRICVDIVVTKGVFFYVRIYVRIYIQDAISGRQSCTDKEHKKNHEKCRQTGIHANTLGVSKIGKRNGQRKNRGQMFQTRHKIERFCPKFNT
ncbi:TPA: hypothetical protein ACGO85_002139 [Streptococcus suis]